MAKSVSGFSLVEENYENDLKRRIDYYRSMLERIVLSLFNWKCENYDLPVELIEKILTLDGSIIFTKDRDLGVVFGRMKGMDINFYGLPKHFILTSLGANVISNIKKEDCVVVYSNNTLKGIKEDIEMYAKSMAEVSLASSRNVATSYGIMTSTVSNANKQLLQKLNTCKQIYGMKPIIIDGIDTLQDKPMVEFISNDYKGNEYMMYLKSLLGNFLETVGIYSLGLEKRERLITSEAERSEVCSMTLQDMINHRKDMVKRIKEKYGLDLSFEVNFDYIRELNDNANFNDNESDGLTN